ncbi:hypothetical protein B0I35DRAFT_411843 [Stachybotrys elegans]|uniref:Phytocyanin domain-containing protein n=1 Tax=Stachybotrys elegans TaxID=80388 RepID=A0A8K0WPB8_9HYPO|nr:hypothetical protein B0I35DRAFT_411843 [Stachybotrys elegans]
MKFSASVAMALAPVALARNVRRESPSDLVKRDGHLAAPAPAPVHPPLPGMASGSHETIIIIWANPGGGAATTTINEKVTVTHTVIQEVTQPAAVHPPPAAPVHPPPAEAAPVHPPAVSPPPVHPPPPAEHVPAAAATHTVTVGGPGGLTYQPDQLQANVGDLIIFEFLAQNHTISQSAFATPCDPLAGGMDSGFEFANPNNTVTPPPQVALQVMSPEPMWFYCKQGNHCGQGMVFSVNPTAEKTHALFMAKAIEQKGNGGASPITGGDKAPPAAPAAPPAAPPAAAPPAEFAPGKGQVMPDGSCNCMASCSFSGFPAVGAQGVGASGGYGGALPMNMAAMKMKN